MEDTEKSHHHRHHPHHHKTEDKSKRDTSNSRDATPVSSSDGEEFHGAPLNARISYHAGLNLDEREAFKLCFPSYSHAAAKQPEDTSAGAGDNISRLIKKMRNSMGSVDPGQLYHSEDDSDDGLTPVHQTESSMNLITSAAAQGQDPFKQDMINRLRVAESSHSVGDYGSSRRNNTVSPARPPKGNECHVFSEGHASTNTDMGHHS